MDISATTLSNHDISEYVSRLRTTDNKEEKDRILTKIIGAVVKYISSEIAHFHLNHNDVDDVRQEIYITLILHIPDYTESRGAFVTFCKPYIREAIRNYISGSYGLTSHKHHIYMHVKQFLEYHPEGGFEEYNQWAKKNCPHWTTRKGTYDEVMTCMRAVHGDMYYGLDASEKEIDIPVYDAYDCEEEDTDGEVYKIIVDDIFKNAGLTDRQKIVLRTVLDVYKDGSPQYGALVKTADILNRNVGNIRTTFTNIATKIRKKYLGEEDYEKGFFRYIRESNGEPRCVRNSDDDSACNS